LTFFIKDSTKGTNTRVFESLCLNYATNP